VTTKEERLTMLRRLEARVLAHLAEQRGRVKRVLLARTARRIGRHLLGNWLTAWDPVHLGTTRAVHALERLLRARSLGLLVDQACDQLFHGHVVPVQRALELIAESGSAALGRCVCRSAGLVDDLAAPAPSSLQVDPRLAERHLACILAAWRALPDGAVGTGEAVGSGEGVPRVTVEPTAPELQNVLVEVAARDDLPAAGRLDLLWRRSWPWWEILLTHPLMTPEWQDNMARHGKCWPVARPLLVELASALYHLRGVVFTRMEAVGQPYALCSCPGPEADLGCSLIHWHYFSGAQGALFVNEREAHGQLRDATGRPLPCARHPERAGRPCLGCGCPHLLA